ALGQPQQEVVVLAVAEGDLLVHAAGQGQQVLAAAEEGGGVQLTHPRAQQVIPGGGGGWPAVDRPLERDDADPAGDHGCFRALPPERGLGGELVGSPLVVVVAEGDQGPRGAYDSGVPGSGESGGAIVAAGTQRDLGRQVGEQI